MASETGRSCSLVEFVPTNGGNAVALGLKPGVCYLVFRPVLEQLRKNGVVGRHKPYEVPNPWDGGKVRNLLLIAGGGLGDRIQLTPALREIARAATCQVDVCNVGSSAPEWRYLPYLGNVSAGLVPRILAEQYEAVVSMGGVIGAPQAQQLPMHQLFAEWFGVKLEDETPDYCLMPGEERLVCLPEQRFPRVGVHFGLQSPARVWPGERWLYLIDELSAQFEVVLLGHASEAPLWTAEVGGHSYSVPPPRDTILDYTGFTPSVRALAVALKTCDAFVGSDSGPLHLAGTLGVPSVGLYGTFPWELRGINLPSIVPVQHPGTCPQHEEGCFTHAQHGEKLPCGRPTCAMMEAIEVGEVLDAVRRVITRGKRQTDGGAGGQWRAEGAAGRGNGWGNSGVPDLELVRDDNGDGRQEGVEAVVDREC